MATKRKNGAYIIEIITHLSFVIHIFFKIVCDMGQNVIQMYKFLTF